MRHRYRLVGLIMAAVTGVLASVAVGPVVVGSVVVGPVVVGPVVVGSVARADIVGGNPSIYLVNRGYPGCATDRNTVHHAIAVLNTCTYASNQRWQQGNPVEYKGNTYFALINAATGRCLTASSNYAAVHACVSSNPDQYWRRQDLGDGWSRLVTRRSGLVLGTDESAPNHVAVRAPADVLTQSWNLLDGAAA